MKAGSYLIDQRIAVAHGPFDRQRLIVEVQCLPRIAQTPVRLPY